MNRKLINEIIAMMPTHLAVKVNRVAKDRKISVADAVIFLIKEGINASRENINNN